MPVADYTQYKFPLIPAVNGYIEVTINKNNHWYDMAGPGTPPANNGTVTITAPLRAILDDEITLKKNLSDEDGDLVVDEINLSFYDYLSVTVNGGTVLDFAADGKTLFGHIFDDYDAEYTLFLKLIKSDSTTEIFFVGEVNPKEIEESHSIVFSEHTAGERRLQTVNISARMLVERLKNKTIQGFIDAFISAGSWGLTECNPEQGPRFYAGCHPDKLGWELPGFDADYWFEEIQWWESASYSLIADPSAFPVIDQAGEYNAIVPSGPFPKGVWAISIEKIISMIADLCNYTFNGSLDFIPGIQYFARKFDNATNLYDDTEHIIGAGSYFVIFNHVFGVSPHDGFAHINTPITYSRESSVKEVIADLCLQFGCRLAYTIHQTHGQVTLRMISRRQDMGDLPTSWRLLSSKRNPVIIRKKRVAVKTKGGDSSVICPTMTKGDIATIEVPFKTRNWGNITGGRPYEKEHFQHATGRPFTDQFEYSRLTDPSDKDKLGPYGWMMASYLYCSSLGASNYFYPDAFQPPYKAYNSGAPSDTWSGFYALGEAREDTSVTSLRNVRIEYALAQFYAWELLNDRHCFERSYHGILATDGTIASMQPGIQSTITVNGVSTTFKATEVKQDIIRGDTFIKWEEVIDLATVTPLPMAVYVGNGSSATGGASSTGSGGSSPTTQTSASDFVVNVLAVSNIALDGTTTAIDGVTLEAGNIVLPVGQTTAQDRIPWIVTTSGMWIPYSTVADEWRTVSVKSGTSYGGSVWHLVTTGTIAYGVTSLAWEEMPTTGRAVPMAANARVGVRLNSGGSTYTRRTLNLIAGAGVSLSHADDSPNEEVDVTITATGAIDGGGTANYVTKWADSNTLADSLLFDNGTGVGLGVTSLSGVFHVKSTSGTAALYVENTSSGNGVTASASGTGSGGSISHTGSGHGLVITKSSSGRGINLTHSGSAEGVYVAITGTGTGLYVTTAGSGAINLYRNNNAPTAPLLKGVEDHASASQDVWQLQNDGVGTGLKVTQAGGNASTSIAIYGLINNAANGSPAVYGQTNGSGSAVKGEATGSGNGVHGVNTGSGYVGLFTRNSTTGSAAAVLVEATNSGDSKPALHVTQAAASGTGGHGVKVLQTGTGKGGEFTTSNTSNTQPAIDAYTNGSGIGIKAITQGAGRAGYFEANRASASDPAVEIRVANTSDTGTCLLVESLGTGTILSVKDNGTSILRIDDGSKVGLFGVTPVGQGTALTAEDASTVDTTYGTQERDVIKNLRTRVGEIETALKNIGLIA